MSFAPILISVYNRKNHLIRLIDSLQKNLESLETDLFIVSDAAQNSDDEIVISEIRDFVTTIKGFNKIELIARSTNYGAHQSSINAINYIFEKYDALIYLEDDNFVSPNFLSFLNQGLNYYKHNPFVFSVCAYNYPISILNPSSASNYFFTSFSAWGVGIWEEKWNAVEMNCDMFKLANEIKKQRSVLEQNLGEKVFMTIQSMIENKRVYADALISYHCFKNNMVSVFPEISKVRNFGHDGLGEHGGYTNKYINQVIDQDNKNFIFESQIVFNPKINKSVLQYFKISIYEKFVIFLRKNYYIILKRM